jgi:hypothetical protein
MKWAEYYDRYWQWAESTRINRISTLTDFTSSAEVAEVAPTFCDEKVGSRLVKRAMQHGVRFTPSEIIELDRSVTDETLREAILNRRGRFNAEEEYEWLESAYYGDPLLETVAKEDGIRREDDDLPFGPGTTAGQPAEAGTTAAQPAGSPGLLSLLFGLGGQNAGNAAHPGRCTRDCANCPAHYGYRYGRWYYGHHHAYGCEFGGNDGSRRP